ncbi:MAG TPA: hypothetical protein VF509_01975 [Sphingobium sp.]
MQQNKASRFQRFILPGLAFKAVVIGGGYATGRELVEFFLGNGPLGGMLGMLVAMIVWSVVCATTFAFAWLTQSFDYRTFFGHLLGKFWWLFEIGYWALLIVVLSVFGAAAGAIVHALTGLPDIVGTCLLAIAITGVVTFGNSSVERLFKYVSFVIYGIYAVFLLLALTRFGDRIVAGFQASTIEGDWLVSGLAYSGYNVVGAVSILPVTRHVTSRRDAVIAGLTAGPLAIAPAMLFFAAMAAFYPAIGNETLPSDFLLLKIGIPTFAILFQVMILAALLESGAGCVHAVNERISHVFSARGRALGWPLRLATTTAILLFTVGIAHRIGLVALIASGYRALTIFFFAIFILPLLIVGGRKVLQR